MRHITHLVVHCTATPQTTTIASIQSYWRMHRKWKNPGYHYIIKPNGEIVQLQPEDKPTNGVADHNAHSIHISYIGSIDAKGMPIDNRTPQQKLSLHKLLTLLKKRYPKAIIQGHKDFPNVKKACPSFDARTEYKGL